MKIYEWGTFEHAEDPQKIGEYIEGVEEKEGKIDPKRLVELAKDRENIMHEMFLWDDSLAAQKFREHEARKILGNLKVTIIEAKVDQVRAFVNIRDNGNSTYKSMEIVMNTPKDLDYVISQAKRELQSFTKKYAKYKKLKGVVDKIQLVIEEFEK